ncbi:hypothetical protein GVAV_001987 [Gurleya vavrai]
MAKNSRMTEELIVQTILGNLQSKKRIFYKCLLKEYTYKNLYSLVDAIEDKQNDSEDENTDDSDSITEQDNIQELTDKIEKMNNNVQKIKKN